jgi:hypothetical protein
MFLMVDVAVGIIETASGTMLAIAPTLAGLRFVLGG